MTKPSRVSPTGSSAFLCGSGCAINKAAVLRLDYISCLLTIASTILIGRRMWSGWIVAGANSAIICVIGIRTAQTGFIPANLFCLAIYGYNLVKWRAHDEGKGSQQASASGTLVTAQAHEPRNVIHVRRRAVKDEQSIQHRDRIRPRRLRRQRESRTPF